MEEESPEEEYCDDIMYIPDIEITQHAKTELISTIDSEISSMHVDCSGSSPTNFKAIIKSETPLEMNFCNGNSLLPSTSCHSLITNSLLKVESRENTQHERQRRFYSLSEKLIAVEFAESTSTNRAAREFNVDRKRIKEWRTNKEKIIYACKNWDDGERKRQRGGGKKPISNDLELSLLQWVECEMCKPQPKISWRILQAKALEIFDELKCRGVVQTQVFKASNGWLQNFLKRHSVPSFPAASQQSTL